MLGPKWVWKPWNCSCFNCTVGQLSLLLLLKSTVYKQWRPAQGGTWQCKKGEFTEKWVRSLDGKRRPWGIDGLGQEGKAAGTRDEVEEQTSNPVIILCVLFMGSNYIFYIAIRVYLVASKIYLLKWLSIMGHNKKSRTRNLCE